MDSPNLFYQQVIDREIGPGTKLDRFNHVGGGCIHHGVRLIVGPSSYFLKWNDPSGLDMFEKEMAGLDLLREADAFNLPEVVGAGTIDSRSYLLMHFVESAPRSGSYWEQFGHSLAQLHRRSNDHFGLGYDNYIGSLLQVNTVNTGWIDFFIRCRLVVMVQRAFERNLMDRGVLNRFDLLYSRLGVLLTNDLPSLLHGDLWSGNVLVGDDGHVCLIDPAVYYGHREIELAFTRLFGGFDHRFYQAYHNEYPLEPGFEDRFEIYNLYPLLVHLNLFGLAYLPAIKEVLKKYGG